MVISGFQDRAVAGAYIIAMVLLGFHLWHAASSWLQTLGVNHTKYNALIQAIGPVVAVIPIPKSKIIKGKLAFKACQQYAITEFEENIVLLDTGHAKLMSPFFPLNALREIPGLENARYEDPYGGGIGNSIRYTAMAPRDNGLKVEGVDNLFCAGEKVGLIVGHTEAICTGTLAGYNAVKHIKNEKLMTLPRDVAVGELIGYVQTQMRDKGVRDLKYTFSGSVFFNRMKKLGLYTTDVGEIEKRIDSVGLSGIFS